jgi:cytochrome c-type biogenesis protein CcmE
MKKVKLLLIFLVFAFCSVEMGSALKVNNLEITPTGDLQPGDAVTVRGTVDLGSNGFDEDNYLEFYTQLDRPTVHWGYAVGLDDKYPPITTSWGSYLRIYGWVLSYPDDIGVTVQVTLDGVVPESASSGQLTVFRARQLDEDDDLVGTEVLRLTTGNNPADSTPTTSPPFEGPALKVINLEITPTGDLQPGDAVTVRGTVDLGSNGFDQDNYLEFYTQLDRPTVHWGYAVGLDDKYPPITTSWGSYLRIYGWVLSYPDDIGVTVQVTLDGVVPESVSSGQLTVFRARQLDEDDELVKTEVLRQKAVDNPAENTPTVTTAPPVTTTVIPTTSPSVTSTTPGPTKSPSPTLTTIPSPQPTKSGEIPLASVVLAGCSLVFISLFHKRIR